MRTELELVVTEGWQLPSKSRLANQLRYLLMLAEGPPSDTFEDRARRLLQLLDAALRKSDAAHEYGGQPTDEQRLGLRILFGTHPEYRDARASARRLNAAEYLAEPRRGSGPLRADTLYRQRQPEWLQLAIDCLRATYGQDEFRPKWIRDQVISVTQDFDVDADGLLIRSTTNYASRAWQDGLKYVYRTIIHPKQCVGVEVVPCGHLQLQKYNVRRHNTTAIMDLPEPLALGEFFEWSFSTNYNYPTSLNLQPYDGCSLTWEHNSQFRLHVIGHFASTRPKVVWWHASSLYDYPQPAYPQQRLDGDADGQFVMKRVRANLSRYAYGIAWRWSKEQRATVGE